MPVRALLRAIENTLDAPNPLPPDADEEPRPGRWYDAGIDRTCELLEGVGYRVLDRDMAVNFRDPVIHLVKQ